MLALWDHVVVLGPGSGELWRMDPRFDRLADQLVFNRYRDAGFIIFNTEQWYRDMPQPENDAGTFFIVGRPASRLRTSSDSVSTSVSILVC